MLRPQAETLPDAAVVPKENLVSPPPDRFTHLLRRSAPFVFDGARDTKSRGELPAGTRVALIGHPRGARCRVVDERGLSVEIDYDALAPLG